MSPGILAILWLLWYKIQHCSLHPTQSSHFCPGSTQTNISRNLTVLIKDVRNISMIVHDQCTGICIHECHNSVEDYELDIFLPVGHIITQILQYPHDYETITFLPGYHQTIITGNLTVLIMKYLHDWRWSHQQWLKEYGSMHLIGSLRFVFVNVTSLKLTNLRFAFCWHSFLYSERVFLYTCDYKW